MITQLEPVVTSETALFSIYLPIGWLGIATKPMGLTGLIFKDSIKSPAVFEPFQSRVWSSAEIKSFDRFSTLESLVAKALMSYFQGEKVDFNEIPVLFTSGTPFQQGVWHALRDVPYGETRSYAWLAEAAGSPKAYRAAGQANRCNPIPIIVPCHRIVPVAGGLGGYLGVAELGINKKRNLLQLEGSI